MKHILLNNWGEQTQFGDEIWPVYATLQKKIFYQNILWKMWPFLIFKEPSIKKESEEVCVPI